MRIEHIIPKPFRKKSKWHLSALIFNQRLFPYHRLVKLQIYWLSQPWLQNLFFPRRVRLLQLWAKQCSNPDISSIVLGSLMANTFKPWRRMALNQPEALNRWVNVKGIQYFENAVSQQRGVIIVCTHSSIKGTGLFRQIVRAYSSVDFSYIGHVDYAKGRPYVMAAFALQIVEAQKLLRRGGIMVIAGDGLKGGAHLNLPLYGHMFPFRSGFAEMAVRTGAFVLAAFDYLDLDGHITFEFVELLQPPPGPKEIQVDSMIQQYARILVDRWPHLLSTLGWHKLQQVMDMPPTTE